MSTANSKPVVAVFDFDGTLTWADSFVPFLREAVGPMRFWAGLFWLSPVLAAHAVGLVQNARTKEFFLAHFLGGRTPESLEPVSARFIAGRLAGLLNPEALERLRWHQREGHRVILLSASPELYLNHWARTVGIATMIGTRLELAADKISGRIAGENCHGTEKIARLRGELGELNQFTLHAYGDSRADLPLLNLAEHAYYKPFQTVGKVGNELRALAKFLQALW